MPEHGQGSEAPWPQTGRPEGLNTSGVELLVLPTSVSLVRGVKSVLSLSLCLCIFSMGACGDRPAKKPAKPALPLAKPEVIAAVSPCEGLVGDMAQDNASGIMWGTARKPCQTLDECVEAGAAAMANIDEVLVECIPVHHSPQARQDTYEIAVTATIKQRVKDTKSGNFCDEVIFEARTLAGVVLASANEKLCLIHGKGATVTAASARITPLSDEEIRRVAVVTARWKYSPPSPLTLHRVQ